MFVCLISLLNKKMTAMLACCQANFKNTIKIDEITSKVLIDKVFGIAHGYQQKYSGAQLMVKSVE